MPSRSTRRRLFAFYARHGLGAAVGGEHLAVEDHVGRALGHRPLQGLRQARGLRGQHVDRLGDVAVGGRAGYPVVAAEGLDAGAVAEPAQREFRLLTTGQLPCSGPGWSGGAARRPAAVTGSEAVPRGRRAWHDRGSSGVLGPKMICGKTSSTGAPRPFPACPDCPRASPERTSCVVKSRVSDPLSLRSPHCPSTPAAPLLAATFRYASHTSRFGISNGFCFRSLTRSSRFRLTREFPADSPSPSLHRHYSSFITTTGRSAPVPWPGTLPLAVSAA